MTAGDRTATGAGPARDRERIGLLVVAAPELAALAARRRPAVSIAAAALTPVSLEALRPRAIAIAVFAVDPDAFHLLARLSRSGYAGRVLALAPPLPRRTLVERELRAQGPGLRLRLLCLPGLADPAA